MKKLLKRLGACCLLACMMMGMFTAAAQASSYDFGFHINDDGLTWAEWQNRNNGINFRVQVQNFSSYDYVSGFTLAISAKNAYGDPILLKTSDGDWYDTLWYNSDVSYKPGRVAYSEYFYIQGDEPIKYVTVTMVKYRLKGGQTVEIDPYDYDSRTWTID